MVQYTEQWEEERMNPGQCLPTRGRMRMCLGRRALPGPVTFYFLSCLGNWMAFILLLFNLHLFPFFVYVTYFGIYKNISHWARVRRKPFPRLGWWPVVLCSRGPGRTVSNTVCQTIFWFCPCDSHPDKASVWGRLSALQPEKAWGLAILFSGSWAWWHAATMIHLCSLPRHPISMQESYLTAGHCPQNTTEIDGFSKG